MRPSEGFALRVNRHGLAARSLAAVLSITTAWVPWALAWGDALSEVGREAQGEGRALAGAVTLPQVNGTTLTLFPGQTDETQINFDALFPGAATGNSADYSGLFGNDLGVVNAGRAAQGSLVTEDSAMGRAYRTLRGTLDRSRPDMGRDPLWSQTDDVLANLGTLTRSFADCSWTSEFAERERRTHVPAYRTCERVMDYSGACAIRHSYEVREIFRNGSGGTLTDCGHGCTLWTVGRSLPTGACYQALTGTMEVLKPEAIISAQLEEVWFEDYIAGLWVNGVNHYSLTAGACENSDSPTVWLGHDLTGYFKTAGVKQVRLDLIQGGDLGGGTAKIRIRYDPKQAVIADTWEDNPSCLTLVKAIGDGACAGPIACALMPATSNGCIPITGASVCPEDVLPSPVAGISNLCERITVSGDCSGFYQGQMDCWSDPQGVLHCPYNPGGVPTDCAALEQDPSCGFLRSDCVKYAQGQSGLCYVFEETWDCGTLAKIPVLERTANLDCAGPVRCLGADCLDVTPEQSSDFARAAAALQSAQMAASDMQCTGGGCVVFAGEALECKKAVGGIVNCCTTPNGISLADYLSLVFAIGKVDNALLGLDKGNALRGSWETLRDPVVDTWSAVTERFTSVANNLMGKTAADVSDAAARLSLDGFKQALMRETAQWVANVFGEAAANALFSVNGGAAFVGGSLQAGPVQLGGLVGTALSWVMTAYMLYTIAVILIQLIWTCEEEEFELGAKRELKSCHDVGSYCKSKALTACIERRNSLLLLQHPARAHPERADPPAARARLGGGGCPRLHGACGRGACAGRLEPGEPR